MSFHSMIQLAFAFLFGLYISACSHQRTHYESEATENPVLKAIFFGDSKRLRTSLASATNVRETDSLGFSYLHLAAGVGNPEVVEALIQAGVPVNVRSRLKQTTPAHSAVRLGRLEALKVLVKHGADLTLVDSDGKTPMDIAAEQNEPELASYLTSVLELKLN